MYFEKVTSGKFVAAVCAVSLTVAAISGRAATLTNVPFVGGMVMPMVSYHASDGMMHVMMPGTVPQLTPLMVSNPGDSFDPADPWFGALDPSAQGAAFSRRYGFVMDGNTDLLPAGTQIWIRKLSGSPGLSAYRYQETAPKALQPIFGTDGVTNALYWNGMMFHPVFAAPPGTNSYSATFEVFLLDTTTGNGGDRFEQRAAGVHVDGRAGWAACSEHRRSDRGVLADLGDELGGGGDRYAPERNVDAGHQRTRDAGGPVGGGAGPG